MAGLHDALVDDDLHTVVSALVVTVRTRTRFDQTGTVAALSSRPDRFDRPAGDLPYRLLDGILTSVDPRRMLEAVMASELGARWYPEVVALDMPPVPGAAHKDNLDHSIRVAANVPVRRRLRWAALCHDLGKPATRRVTGEKVTFVGHERVGAAVTRRFLTRLGAAPDLVDEVVTLVRYSGRAADFDDTWTDSAVRRFLVDTGDLFDDVCWLTRADCTSRHPDRRRVAHRRVDRLRARAAEVTATDQVRARRPVLDGTEIMTVLGVDPGPVVGAAITHLLSVDPDATLSRDQAIQVLVDWYRRNRT